MTYQTHREGIRDILQLSPFFTICFFGIYGFFIFARIYDKSQEHVRMLWRQKARLGCEITLLSNYSDDCIYPTFVHNESNQNKNKNECENMNTHCAIHKREYIKDMILAIEYLIEAIPKSDIYYSMDFIVFSIPATKSVARGLISATFAGIFTVLIRLSIAKA